MKRFFVFIAVISALVVGLPQAGSADTGDGCLATADNPCTVQAGSEDGNLTLDDGTIVLSGRVSWIGVGNWEIARYPVACADVNEESTPDRTWSSESDNNVVDGLAGANNGGGFYDYCMVATALDAQSFVLMGALHTELLP